MKKEKRVNEVVELVRHASTQVWKFYEIKENKVLLRRRKCPRCGSFMAEHENRFSCGKCGYTEFKTNIRGP
jgi:small subunit ribosomal protein S27Ae